MNEIACNLTRIRQQIRNTAQSCARDPKEITLLAVSKTKSVIQIAQAMEAGQLAFGENYVQEGVEKIRYFADNGMHNLQWHFIGPLQANKTRLVAEHFHWCHTLDRLRIADRLNDQRPPELPPLNVLIQINISDENSKSGIAPDSLLAFAEQVAALPRLSLRGIMAIPAPESDYEKQFAVARQMALAFALLKQHYNNTDTLSLGMSGDMQSAIAAGSTLVRIGSAIFGARDTTLR